MACNSNYVLGSLSTQGTCGERIGLGAGQAISLCPVYLSGYLGERIRLGQGRVGNITMSWQFLRVPGKRVGLGQGMQ